MVWKKKAIIYQKGKCMDIGEKAPLHSAPFLKFCPAFDKNWNYFEFWEKQLANIFETGKSSFLMLFEMYKNDHVRK